MSVFLLLIISRFKDTSVFQVCTYMTWLSHSLLPVLKEIFGFLLKQFMACSDRQAILKLLVQKKIAVNKKMGLCVPEEFCLILRIIWLRAFSSPQK